MWQGEQEEASEKPNNGGGAEIRGQTQVGLGLLFPFVACMFEI